MVTLEELKKTLANPEKYTEEELCKINLLLEGLAKAIVDQWFRKEHKKDYD